MSKVRALVESVIYPITFTKPEFDIYPQVDREPDIELTERRDLNVSDMVEEINDAMRHNMTDREVQEMHNNACREGWIERF